MYNKLFTKILDSSIWLEPAPTRLVWVTFLAAMDESGFVQFASAPNVAIRARVSLKATEEAIRCLESPDPISGDPEHEGRRIEKVPGGWMVLNAEKYRDLVTRHESKERNRQRVAKHRANKRNAGVTPCNAPVMQSEADTYTEADTKKRVPRARRAAPPAVGFEVFWDAYPLKVGKAKAVKAWNSLSPDCELRARISAALEWQRDGLTFMKDGEVCGTHPATWLNGERWNDEQPARSIERQVESRPELGAWRDECDRVHGGTNGDRCGSSVMHRSRMQTGWQVPA